MAARPAKTKRGAKAGSSASRARSALRGKPVSEYRRKTRRAKALKVGACALVIALCALLAVLVGTTEYRATAIGWVPLIAVVAVIAGAFAYLQVIKRGLKIAEKSALSDCRRGRDIAFTVQFRNATPLFFFRIEAYFYIADKHGNVASEAMTTLTLAPREVYDLDFSARFDHIGTYNVGLSRVVVTDFLRLFTSTLENPTSKPVQVVPFIQPIERIEFSNEALIENARAAKSALADSLDYASVRDYSFGDPLKTVHWKLSARAGHYLTKLYEVYTNPGLAIIMGFYSPDENSLVRMGLFDAVVESAFSIARYGMDQGMETEVHYCDEASARKQVANWSESDLAEVVADIPRMSKSAARRADVLSIMRDEGMSQYGQNNVVICTADLSSEMVTAVIDMKARHRTPLLVAVVPNTLVDREREDYCSVLSRLDSANIGYIVVSRSEELAGVRA